MKLSCPDRCEAITTWSASRSVGCTILFPGLHSCTVCAPVMTGRSNTCSERIAGEHHPFRIHIQCLAGNDHRHRHTFIHTDQDPVRKVTVDRHFPEVWVLQHPLPDRGQVNIDQALVHRHGRQPEDRIARDDPVPLTVHRADGQLGLPYVRTDGHACGQQDESGQEEHAPLPLRFRAAIL